jgi:hypothetical protein
MKKIKLLLFALITMCFFTTGVKAEEVVAKIGDNEYTSLDTAIEMANDGDTIELFSDGNVTKAFNKSLTFKGKYTITFDGMLDNTGEAQWSYKGNMTFDETSFIWDATNWNNQNKRWVMLVLSGKLKLDNGSVGTFRFDSLNGVKCAIYSNNGATIEVDHDSTLNIFGTNTKGINGQAIQLDNTAGTGIFVKNNSTVLIDGTNRGYVNSPKIYVENSNFIVQNCTSNASNGGMFTAVNSEIKFLNNNGHGLSAAKLESVNSNITTNNNAFYGITVISGLRADKNTEITSNENGYGFTGGAIRIYLPSAIANFESGSTINLNKNYRNALENYGTTTFEDGSILNIIENAESDNGAGIFNKGMLVLPTKANITLNKASKLGGGIYNEGNIIIPTNTDLYNNHAEVGGDDIYNIGTITFDKVGEDWILDDCEHKINGWYDDQENNRWEAHDRDNIHVELIEGGSYEGTLAIKAAHDNIGKVIINYVDSDNNKLTDEIISNGEVGTRYETEKKNFEGYTFIIVEGPTSGEYDFDTIYVTYYYDNNTGTGDIMPPQTGFEPSTINNTRVETINLYKKED